MQITRTVVDIENKTSNMQYGAQYRQWDSRWKNTRIVIMMMQKRGICWPAAPSRHTTTQKAPQRRQRGITKRRLDLVFCWVGTSDLNTFIYISDIIDSPMWVGIVQSVHRAGRSGDRIPEGCEIFRTRLYRTSGPPSPLYDGYPVFPRGKAAGAWRWPATPIYCRG